ncbi:VTT domain-containing protein [Levilactobacillus suantsaiihabitans]|uniref:Alkaline phosphatase n=1 Tax=Levilactobacillus suantsaiihabitans TaxID=2487722 RepID=A0A4Z0JDK7_9LACO|nr:VTT domain-containing protein [Levilactobacillus suantsaiihabitans]TGD19779.1 alkaline phosphatase [Levilactobacillus suantsaiihabitans]
MSLIALIWEVVWHPLTVLVPLTNQLGTGIYPVLFFLIFLESGMLIFSFIPGQSLLFMMGSIAAYPQSRLNIWWLIVMFTLAATAGSAVKYLTTRKWGDYQEKLIQRLPEQKVARATAVFTNNEDQTLLIGRFIPFVGLFVPIIAGTTDMDWRQFRFLNLLGSFIWVVSCSAVGYFFGNTPFIRENFTWLFLGLLAVPFLARQGWQYWRSTRRG